MADGGPWLRACFGVSWGMRGTDLGLFDLEVLIVVIDDGVFWAARPDEADALARNTMTEDDRPWHHGQPF